MGFFGNISNAKYSEGGVYLQPGVYRLKINRCKKGVNRENIPYFVAEFEVLESTVESQPPGTQVSWMAQIKPNTPALGNVRQFVETAGGFSFDDATKGMSAEEASAEGERIMDGFVGEENALAELVVRASCQNIKTKRGTDFTKVTFVADQAAA